MAKSAGLMTEYKTNAGRPIYISDDGEVVSEKSMTLPYKGKFVNVPSIHDGISYSEDELIEMLDKKEIKPTSTHKTMDLAVKKAEQRSPDLMDQETMMLIEDQYGSEIAKRISSTKGREKLAEESDRGNLQDEEMEIRPIESGAEYNMTLDDQTKMTFADGGLLDEGGTVDPVSGNDVPPGSTQEEVRDDIPAQLSEGEFVFPADVVRYIGLENLMQIRQKAKEGLAKMDAMGQMGNSEEATISDDVDYDSEIDSMIDEMNMAQEFAYGGMVQENTPIGQTMMQQPATIYAQQGTFVPPVTPPAPPQLPTYAQFMGRPEGGPASSPVVYGTDQYIGPNGDIIGITTINGNPVQDVPAGYKKYNPAVDVPAQPKIAEPAVTVAETNNNDEDPEAETATDPTMTALDQMKSLGIVDDKIIDSYKKSANRVGVAAILGGPAGVLSSPVAGEKVKSSIHSDIAKTMGMTKDQFEDTFVDKNFLGMTEGYKNLEEMKALQDSYKERKPAFDNKSDEEKTGLQKTAEKYGTLAWSEQTEMLKEQDDFLEDDDDDEDTTTDSTEQTDGGYEGFGDEPGEDEFNKGGVVKQRKNKGLGRLKK